MRSGEVDPVPIVIIIVVPVIVVVDVIISSGIGSPVVPQVAAEILYRQRVVVAASGIQSPVHFVENATDTVSVDVVGVL